MCKITETRFIVIFSICAFMLFFTPELLRGAEAGQGTLVGYVYGPDNTTPVEGAVVKLKNISTGSSYESPASDDQGMVEFPSVDKGLYIVGVSTGQGDYNINNVIGVKANRTAKISFALESQGQEGEAVAQSKRCPKGEWYVPDIKGQCDNNYKWNLDTERCECQRRNPLAFFLTPLGAGVVVAASAGVVAFSLSTDGEAPSSAFK
jgi:hypothetical protein